MLAIPLSRPLSWKNPPLMTVLLVLVNSFIYFIIQANDSENMKAVGRYYIESGLAELEVSHYVSYINAESNRQKDKLSYESIEDEQFYLFLKQMASDDIFMDKLLAEQIITKSDPQYHEWRAMRSEYDLKRDKIVSWRHGFRPAEPRPSAFFSYMFLHGGMLHLIGNMVFLWLIGCLIEYGCGRVVFSFLYLFGGLTAVGLFWLFHMDSNVPLVGASGAISGIMGAFCVLYGRKKVRLFLTLGFYFNYLIFPAIVMLPLWLGHEIIQMWTSKGGNIAYLAHIGGLIGGAGITFAVGRWTRYIDHDIFQDASESGKKDRMIEQAFDHIRNLEFAEARPLLHQILIEKPGNLEVLRHLFNMEKHFPESEEFHKSAGLFIKQLCRQPDDYEEVCRVYKEYVDTAGKPRLSTALYVRLSMVFIALGHVSKAHALLVVLLKRAPAEPGLPSAFLKLAKALKKKGMKTNYRNCLELIVRRFPTSSEALIARRGLDETG